MFVRDVRTIVFFCPQNKETKQHLENKKSRERHCSHLLFYAAWSFQDAWIIL